MTITQAQFESACRDLVERGIAKAKTLAAGHPLQIYALNQAHDGLASDLTDVESVLRDWLATIGVTVSG